MLSLAAIIVKEEDTLVLSLAESILREEQKQIQTPLTAPKAVYLGIRLGVCGSARNHCRYRIYRGVQNLLA
jgi:hypothetical protein